MKTLAAIFLAILFAGSAMLADAATETATSAEAKAPATAPAAPADPGRPPFQSER